MIRGRRVLLNLTALEYWVWWSQISGALVLPASSCVTLSETLGLSKPQFPHQ